MREGEEQPQGAGNGRITGSMLGVGKELWEDGQGSEGASPGYFTTAHGSVGGIEGRSTGSSKEMLQEGEPPSSVIARCVFQLHFFFPIPTTLVYNSFDIASWFAVIITGLIKGKDQLVLPVH